MSLFNTILGGNRMNLEEIRAKEEWTVKEVGYVIGATFERALRRGRKPTNQYGTSKVVSSKSYEELSENITDAFMAANENLYMDKDADILDLYSRAVLWIEEHKGEKYNQEIKQYLIAGYCATV